MPAMKRKAEGPVEVHSTKQARVHEPVESIPNDEELSQIDRDQLIDIIKELQQSLDESRKRVNALAETSGNSSKQPTEQWTPEKIAERAQKIKELVSKEVKKQMKWQPSCKKGSTKWSYQGMVPNAEVFRAVFNIDKAAKPFKLKKITRSEFLDIFGYITASCRYSTLDVTGDHVNLKWNPEELTFQLSGTYGV